MAGLGFTNSGVDPRAYQTWINVDANGNSYPESIMPTRQPSGLPSAEGIMQSLRDHRSTVYMVAAALLLLAILRGRR